MLITGLIFCVIVCFVVPLGGLVLCARRKKGVGKAFFVGAAAFVVSQICVRIPILQLVLPQYAWFAIMQLNPWKYGWFLGLSAGIFEEVARWVCIRFLMKEQRTLAHGLAFGMGHGGIEAMIFVGINVVVCLGMLLGGQGALLPLGPWDAFLAGGERLYAIGFHVGATLLVLKGIRAGKALRYLISAIILHGLLDAAIVILPGVYGVGQMGVWLYGALAGVLTLAAGLICIRKTECQKK